MADVGQEEDFEAARKKAMDCGAVGFFLEDLKKEFIEELIYRELPGVESGSGRVRADKGR
jgi:argininosuccinate synthase